MQIAERFDQLVDAVRGSRALENRIGKLVERVRATHAVPLRMRLWNGRSYELGPDPTVTLTVPTPSALRYLLAPDFMTFGEGYVEGHIDVEGPIHEAFRVGEQFLTAVADRGALAPLRRAIRHTRQHDRDAIEYHYDVSNEFYSLFLDRNMVYTCAYFRNEADSLELAQEQKLDHVLTKLRVRAGRAPARHRLRLGCARLPRGREVRRARARRHALPQPVRVCAGEDPREGHRRPLRGPAAGLSRSPRRGPVRQDRGCRRDRARRPAGHGRLLQDGCRVS